MDALSTSSEEMWHGVQVFTNTFIVTHIVFVLCLFTYWDASFLSGLTDKQKMNVIASMLSYVHVGITIGLVAQVWSEERVFDGSRERSVVSSTTCGITVGFMAGELSVMLTQWKDIGDWLTVIHHLTSSLAFLYVYSVGTYTLLVVVWLMAEYSLKLLVNNRSILYDPTIQRCSVSFCALVGAIFISTVNVVVRRMQDFYDSQSITINNTNQQAAQASQRRNNTASGGTSPNMLSRFQPGSLQRPRSTLRRGRRGRQVDTDADDSTNITSTPSGDTRTSPDVNLVMFDWSLTNDDIAQHATTDETVEQLTSQQMARLESLRKDILQMKIAALEMQEAITAQDNLLANIESS